MFGAAWLGGVIAAVVVVACACSLGQQHGYAQSSDGSLSFRYPPDWEEVDIEPVTVEWVIGLDASPQPSAGNQADYVVGQPFVVAQVLPLEPSVRDQATVSRLRTLALEDRRDPAAGDDPDIRIVFVEDYLDERGFQGQHMRFEVDLETGTAMAEHLAVFDPERNRVQRVRVACSIECFTTNEGVIEEIFDSVRLRP